VGPEGTVCGNGGEKQRRGHHHQGLRELREKEPAVSDARVAAAVEMQKAVGRAVGEDEAAIAEVRPRRVIGEGQEEPKHQVNQGAEPAEGDIRHPAVAVPTLQEEVQRRQEAQEPEDTERVNTWRRPPEGWGLVNRDEQERHVENEQQRIQHRDDGRGNMQPGLLKGFRVLRAKNTPDGRHAEKQGRHESPQGATGGLQLVPVPGLRQYSYRWQRFARERVDDIGRDEQPPQAYEKERVASVATPQREVERSRHRDKARISHHGGRKT